MKGQRETQVVEGELQQKHKRKSELDWGAAWGGSLTSRLSWHLDTAALNVMVSFTAVNTRLCRQTDSMAVRQLARQTGGKAVQMDGSDKVKQREMTERWAAKNNREDREKTTDWYRQTDTGSGNIVKPFRWTTSPQRHELGWTRTLYRRDWGRRPETCLSTYSVDV